MPAFINGYKFGVTELSQVFESSVIFYKFIMAIFFVLLLLLFVF